LLNRQRSLTRGATFEVAGKQGWPKRPARRRVSDATRLRSPCNRTLLRSRRIALHADERRRASSMATRSVRPPLARIAYRINRSSIPTFFRIQVLRWNS